MKAVYHQVTAHLMSQLRAIPLQMITLLKTPLQRTAPLKKTSRKTKAAQNQSLKQTKQAVKTTPQVKIHNLKLMNFIEGETYEKRECV